MSDLFSAAADPNADRNRPLADRLRPKQLSDVTGQEHLTGPEGVLTRMIASGSLGSMIFWGPPGTGKTTVARLLAGETDLAFEQISAIFSGVADLKKVFEAARARRMSGRQTLLFVDEIHRFNRAQQDSFLPVMEDGTVILIGATTENPSFELNAALLSRARVLTFHPHDADSIATLLRRAEEQEDCPLPLDDEARASLVRMADGDGRAALTLAEEVWRAARADEVFTAEKLQDVVQRRAPVYDKGQDGHYNLISALHKSVRGSDPDAALYYLSRMFDAGEDPLYLGGGLCAWRWKISALPIRRHWLSVMLPRMPMTISVHRKANWRWHRPVFTLRRPRSRTLSMWPIKPRCARPGKTVRFCRRSIFSMRRPSS